MNEESEEHPFRSSAQHIQTPIKGEGRSKIEEFVSSPRIELGGSNTTEESVVVDKPEQRKRFWKSNHIAPDAIAITVKRPEEAGDRKSKKQTWVSRKLRHFIAVLRTDMQEKNQDLSSMTGQSPPGRARRAGSTDDLHTSNPQGGPSDKDTDPPEVGQQRVEQPGQSQISSHYQAAWGSTNAGLTLTGRDANGLTVHEAPEVKPSAEQAQESRSSLYEQLPIQYTQSSVRSLSHAPPLAPTLALQALESTNVQASSPIEGLSPDTVVNPEGRPYKRTFRMAIHLPQDRIAQRVCRLDTCADLDVISHRVVESLGLEKDRYQGVPVIPLGGHYKPEWQVTFEWHVAHFPQTYRSTFVVLDEKHSGEFDVLLGHMTIEKIDFYQTNGKVWMCSTEDEAQPI
ncbi:MAG: hypothetical protein Q9184_003120 [Pyrenodesmia sp. 2 TL-2023]